MNYNKPVTFNINASSRILLLALTYLLGLVLSGVAAMMLLRSGEPDKATAMSRIAIVIQDLLVFIVPAITTAIIATRNPAGLLAVDKTPHIKHIVTAIGVMLVSYPAMNLIIEWNASIHLPESLKGLEQTIRLMEDNAAAMIDTVIGPHTIANLIMSILIVGIMTGFAEELFFRGALLRLLSSTRLSPAAAIWTAAVIFSALHFQFFGFVPRMLLAVYFGYLLIWSRSLWLPVIAHTFNNTMYVILMYATGQEEIYTGSGTTAYITAAASVILTIAGIIFLRRICKHTTI